MLLAEKRNQIGCFVVVFCARSVLEGRKSNLTMTEANTY